MAIPMATTEMVADQCRAEMIQLLDLLFQEGILDEEFNRIQSMEDETSPNFVVDVIHSFFRDIEKISKIFHELLEEKENTDFAKVELYTSQMVGCSSSIGAKAIRNICAIFLTAVKQNNRDECLVLLELMDMEFIYYKSKMEEFIEIKREFEIASGIAFPQNEEGP